ncbi:hypothetical protein NDU88_007132 [Pleurodeles waltl]|uniref:Uncharacterized protein n=1 Tax=Pleurodeles waltl TaxID=8319 RepID=A0AAV7VNV6_PLEWA|nr:hypothetical protein NDU88_007132 [Pleurodeles waltl]
MACLRSTWRRKSSRQLAVPLLIIEEECQELPNDKTAGKHTRQLLFSEAISQSHPMASPAAPVASGPKASTNDALSDNAMECILQEIAAVGRRLEDKGSKITDLSMASHSIRSDIASFHDKVTNFYHRLTEVGSQLSVLPERDLELQFLHAKLTDLEDRSRRDNVFFFGIPECKEGINIRAYLKHLLPELTGLTFSPALKFQRAHRISPKQSQESPAPSSLVSYATSRHARLLWRSKAHGPYRMERFDVRMAADFSCEKTTRRGEGSWPSACS